MATIKNSLLHKIKLFTARGSQDRSWTGLRVLLRPAGRGRKTRHRRVSEMENAVDGKVVKSLCVRGLAFAAVLSHTTRGAFLNVPGPLELSGPAAGRRSAGNTILYITERIPYTRLQRLHMVSKNVTDRREVRRRRRGDVAITRREREHRSARASQRRTQRPKTKKDDRCITCASLVRPPARPPRVAGATGPTRPHRRW